MTRPQRSTPAGRAYLDLQHLSRRSGRSMQALLPMFASERGLARLAASPHQSRFVLKGGVLLAALGNRRPTQDADLLALNIANDHDTVIDYVNDVANVELADGVSFVHVAMYGDGVVESPLPGLPAFKAFTADIKARCDELPVTQELQPIGVFSSLG
jgi:hypothetical protein